MQKENSEVDATLTFFLLIKKINYKIYTYYSFKSQILKNLNTAIFKKVINCDKILR